MHTSQGPAGRAPSEEIREKKLVTMWPFRGHVHPCFVGKADLETSQPSRFIQHGR